MSEQYLQVKTSGDVSPQGKQRVFICGLREDIKLYLDEIADDILRLYDCAIWYEKPDADYDDETLLSMLESMTLFVFVVTNRLLDGNNRAIRLILPFAKGKFRAILPIKTEDIDDNRYNTVFDSANYLEKYADDPTAVRYEEKLRIFLSNVLVDEKLSTIIRQAFDAYIFLSYRKKDRRFAQKLLHKIHERDFCRDVAVWYDEYLIPGRNFEDIIRDVLKKCTLFTVALTPNILEKGNWVLEHEIPDALDANKDILLAELTKIDKDRLYEQFDELPECTDVDDDAAFTEALRKALKGIDLMKNADDPEHNFNIGLAYLMGIDTEIDSARALELITGSAEAGYITAIKMLVTMYQTGQGVKPDYRKAQEWQEREADCLRREFEDGKSDGKAYCISLIELSDAYLELGERTKAREVMKRLRDLLDHHPDSHIERIEYIFYHKLGNIAKDEYRNDEALRCYHKALLAAKAQAENDPTPQNLEDLAQGHDMLGIIYLREDNTDAAMPHILEYLRICEELDAHYHTGQTARNLIIGNIHLGEIRQKRGEYDASEQCYRKSLQMAEKLYNSKATPQSSRDVFVSKIKLADLAFEREQYRSAGIYAMSALPHAEGLYKRARTVGTKHDLMDNLKLLQNISDKTGDLESYCFFREKFLDLYVEGETEELEKLLYNQAYLFNELGEKCKQAREYKKADTYYKHALDILTKATEKFFTIELRRELGITCYNLAACSVCDDRPSETSDWLNNAIKIQVELFNQCHLVEVYHDLAMTYLLMGAIGNIEGYNNAIRIWKLLYQSTGDQTYLNAMNKAIQHRDKYYYNK